MPKHDFDIVYSVSLTGREIYWLIYLANKELKRLQDLSDEEGSPMTNQLHNRYRPISEAFQKLIKVGE